MRQMLGFAFALIFPSLLLVSPAISQQLLGSVSTGMSPAAVAVNPATNKTYVVNQCGDPACDTGSVTVIDGVGLQTDTVPNVGDWPTAIAVNSATNKIYVAISACSQYPNCEGVGSVAIIDGATLQITIVNTPGSYDPYAITVNPVTNKIYVANLCGSDPTCQPSSTGSISIINGSTWIGAVTSGIGIQPWVVAVNSVTNQIYVVNNCGSDPTCTGESPGTVTDIDGTTLQPTLITLQDYFPDALAINALTNQIWVVNSCGTDPTCNSPGTVTDIDANHGNAQQDVAVGNLPVAVAIDAVTNQIFVSNNFDNTVSQIDGTQSPPIVAYTIPGFLAPAALVANAATNKIYVANQNGIAGLVTMIDDSANPPTTTQIALGPQITPTQIAVNAVTNRVFTANNNNNNASVIAGASAAALQFFPLPPCRVVDTRGPNGPFGGPPLQGGSQREFLIPSGPCPNIPQSAAAYSLNVTVVPHEPLGYLTIWPTGEDQPNVSTMNSFDGRTKANAAIVPTGYMSAVNVFVTNTTDVILDINGYFAPASSQSLQFYPLTPCRVVDTRGANGPLGGPYLPADTARDFPVLDSSCLQNLLAPAQAYSFNVTVVPYPAGQPLYFLAVYPANNQGPPDVSTLNNATATVVANAAIVPAASDGDIDVYASNSTQVIIDVNGYFAASGGHKDGSFDQPLSFYPVAPCRVLDTRAVGDGEPFSGDLNPPVDVVDSACAPPSTAQAYVFNTTALPTGPLGFLTLWPDSLGMPNASTLNAYDGATTSNMAIVPNADGSIDAYAAGLTQLILDISGYFAP